MGAWDLHPEEETIQADMVAIRRDLHRHPETMYEVSRTAGIVADYLEQWGLEVQRSVGKQFKSGVIGILRGELPGPTLLLRADMDALPIQEETEASYQSEVAGVMHACGHDAHTAMLLGAAKLLSQTRSRVHGTVKFVFQPAEEGARPRPEDGVLISGGRDLIDDGVLEDVDLGFALHVWPELPTGTIGLHRGYAMAASSHFTLEFHGLSGHHATPHQAVDALVMAAQFVMEAKTAMSTEWDPLTPAVLSFGTLKAGTVLNAIAAHSVITGSFRTFGEDAVQKIKRMLERRAQGIADAYGGTYTARYRLGTALRNEERAVLLAAKAGETVDPSIQVRWLESPSLAGEDFALYAERIPCAFAFLGIRNEQEGIVHPLHHPRFDLDERAMLIGARLHFAFVLEAMAAWTHA